MEKIKDKIINKWLQLLSLIRYITNYKSKMLKIEGEYSLVFKDDFYFFDKEKWSISHGWGNFNPSSAWQYCDIDGDTVVISAHENAILQLLTKYQPKKIVRDDLPSYINIYGLPKEVTPLYKAGLIQTNKRFKYGWFIVDVKLPKEKHMWNAFWLFGSGKRYAEIDCFEGYTKENKRYKIMPNVHYHHNGVKKEFGAFKSYIRKTTTNFINYAVHWEKDFIKIYWNGCLVMCITNKNILDVFNDNDMTMCVILNAGLNNTATTTLYNDTTMSVKNMRIYQKK